MMTWLKTQVQVSIVHGNHFFQLYQQNKSSVSKVKFRQACKPCKRVLEAAKLAYTNKTKEPKFGSQKVLSSASDKERLFAENFSKNSNLNDSGISLPF